MPGPKLNRQGFTLIEIVIAVAIVAIMAGTIAPLAFKEMISAREDATDRELAGLNKGLINFYEDTGRFPSETEGLGALLEDPGVMGWGGPYLGGGKGNQLHELTHDAFNEAYTYDLSPDVNSPGADALVASGGANHRLDMGGLNGRWQLDGDGDDLITLISVGQINRDKVLECRQEIQTLAAALTAYYEDNMAFPANIQTLADQYLDRGLNNDAFTDPWHTTYLLSQVGGSGSPVVCYMWSAGPDRQNNGGDNDDLYTTVSSVPPGRKVTMRRLDIAQTVLNNNADLALTGVWNNDHLFRWAGRQRRPGR
ncbi:hypothetical protein CSB20_10125 [bacterium DOLZORAL124_64_63]|nr:MAG: hypothetical protein CSB20_10125 [bacterium DOLZORAL124_64_63]